MLPHFSLTRLKCKSGCRLSVTQGRGKIVLFLNNNKKSFFDLIVMLLINHVIINKLIAMLLC